MMMSIRIQELLDLCAEKIKMLDLRVTEVLHVRIGTCRFIIIGYLQSIPSKYYLQ